MPCLGIHTTHHFVCSDDGRFHLHLLLGQRRFRRYIEQLHWWRRWRGRRRVWRRWNGPGLPLRPESAVLGAESLERGVSPEGPEREDGASLGLFHLPEETAQTTVISGENSSFPLISNSADVLCAPLPEEKHAIARRISGGHSFCSIVSYGNLHSGSSITFCTTCGREQRGNFRYFT
jgi:hypothetical protein